MDITAHPIVSASTMRLVPTLKEIARVTLDGR